MSTTPTITDLGDNMKRTYDAKDIGVESLVGRTILSAFINDSKDAVLLKTDDGDYYLRWEGDCRANCFIAHINGAEFLIGSTILSAENSEWSDLNRNEDDYEVLETMGTKFKTSKGYVDIETRVSHDGYYGGMINISKEGYIDSYHCFIEVKDVTKPLKDF